MKRASKFARAGCWTWCQMYLDKTLKSPSILANAVIPGLMLELWFWYCIQIGLHLWYIWAQLNRVHTLSCNLGENLHKYKSVYDTWSHGASCWFHHLTCQCGSNLTTALLEIWALESTMLSNIQYSHRWRAIHYMPLVFWFCWGSLFSCWRKGHYLESKMYCSNIGRFSFFQLREMSWAVVTLTLHAALLQLPRE